MHDYYKLPADSKSVEDGVREGLRRFWETNGYEDEMATTVRLTCHPCGGTVKTDIEYVTVTDLGVVTANCPKCGEPIAVSPEEKMLAVLLECGASYLSIEAGFQGFE